MNDEAKEVTLRRLQELLSEGHQLQYDDVAPGTAMSDFDLQRLHTRCLSAIEQVSGPGSVYSREARAISSRSDWALVMRTTALLGVTQSLHDDLDRDLIASLAEFLHAEVFSDFLEMASHLLSKKYKNPAAVIIGSALEAHLRRLGTKCGVAIESDDGIPIKADRINAELARQGVYGKLEQKSVTAWLDLRNQAAHGHYDAYDQLQVQNVLEGVRGFIFRNPA